MDPDRNTDGRLAINTAFAANHTEVTTLADTVHDLSKRAVLSGSKCKRKRNVREKYSTHCTIYGSLSTNKRKISAANDEISEITMVKNEH